ncbi:MAG: inorganic phosphate transporter, partial [Candidatus Saganbacteria bacterium]|nr:inorganic phosphate transporter [Candidatus Saganbacteria bacterium]
IFLSLGAFCFGGRVSATLGKSILSPELFTFDVALAVILSACLAIFISNIFKVAQSTSLVTVGALVGAGLYVGGLNTKIFLFLLPAWFILPVVSFVLTFLLFRIIYPPRFKNLWFYERIHSFKGALKGVAILAACFVAFSVGANNVANAVGPLFGAGLVNNTLWGIAIVIPLFIIGAALFGDLTMTTIGKEIVPLGIITSSLVSVVTASLLSGASFVGIPCPLVLLNGASILAVSTLKHGHVIAAKQAETRRMVLIWILAPFSAAAFSYLTLLGLQVIK